MFTVRWKIAARDELTTLWLQADSPGRQIITATVHQFENGLRSDPLSKGESREANQRIWFLFPLAIRFKVEQESSVARVLRVWTYRRRK